MADEFTIDVSRWVDKAKGNLDQITRQVLFEVASRVVYRSPVDTGRFRANWQYSVGEVTVQQSALNAASLGGSEPLSRIAAAIPKEAWGKRHRLSNNLPYARRLEYGWSKQAPAGMVRITVAEFQGIVHDEARTVNP
jgi:hypothetical protein